MKISKFILFFSKCYVAIFYIVSSNLKKAVTLTVSRSLQLPLRYWDHINLLLKYPIHSEYQILIKVETSNFALRPKVYKKLLIFSFKMQILLMYLYSNLEMLYIVDEIYKTMIFLNLLKETESFHYAFSVFLMSW